MERDGIGFHNVVELEAVSHLSGVRLSRYPRAVREAMGERGRFVSEEATGCEIRFVTPAQNARVYVTALNQEADVFVFQGDYLVSTQRLAPGVLRTLHLERPARMGAAMAEQFHARAAFSPEVWRVAFSRSVVHFHGVETFGQPVRPPLPDEVPAWRWLAYGSSITHSSGYHGYPHQAARRLKADVLNHGLSGACHCEREVADYLAGRDDWDLLTMELGVNMRGAFTAEQFAERAGYLIETVTERHPAKPIAVITIFPNHVTYESEGVNAEREQAFNDFLRDEVSRLRKEKGAANLHLIEGDKVLTDRTTLTADLLHPSDFGHACMGENLARLLAPLLRNGS